MNGRQFYDKVRPSPVEKPLTEIGFILKDEEYRIKGLWYHNGQVCLWAVKVNGDDTSIISVMSDVVDKLEFFHKTS